MIAGLSTIDFVALKTHLRTSYDVAHLAKLASVFQKMDNPIHSTNLYPVDSTIDP